MVLAIIAACLAAVMFSLSLTGVFVGRTYPYSYRRNGSTIYGHTYSVSYIGSCFVFGQRLRSWGRWVDPGPQYL